MVAGASTPEELETLFEDAFVMRDPGAVSALYDDGAVLVASAGGPEARGDDAIGRAVGPLLGADRTYVAGSRRVLLARDVALVVADVGVHVLRRSGDGCWRVAISLLDFDGQSEREKET